MSLNKSDAKTNMNLAFDIAEEHLGIPKLFAAEDILNVEKPDERSIMTYVAQYFHAFSALGTHPARTVIDRQSGQRWPSSREVRNRHVASLADAERLPEEVHRKQSNSSKRLIILKDDMADTQQEWTAAVFSDYPDAKSQLREFENYKSSTKREWVMEKRDLESVTRKSLSSIVSSTETSRQN